MKLEPAFIKEQKQRLLASKTEIEKELKDLEGVPDMGSDVDSFEEEADEAEEYVTNLSKSDALKKDLDQIDAALEKIKNGGYGVCKNCGKMMSKELLLAAPESEYCRQCKLESPDRK